MVTLWNDMRLAYGMPPMGFIAPFLYYVQASSPDAFNDITTGNNVSAFIYSCASRLCVCRHCNILQLCRYLEDVNKI